MLRSSLFFCLLLPPLGAVDFRLDDIAERVRTHHPGLKAARLMVEEARGRRLDAGRLANPTLNADWRSESRLSPATSEFSFEQSFPVTRRLTLEKQLTDQLVQAAELEVRDVERRLIAEARQLAVRVVALDEQRRLRRDQQQVAAELAAFAEGRAQAGELSSFDARQVELDAQRLKLEMRVLEAQTVGLLGQLKPFLGLPAEAALRLPESLPSARLPQASNWEERPDYQLAQTKVGAAKTEVELAKAKKWQDWSLGLVGGSEQQHLQSQREGTGYVGLRFSLPLPLWNRNQGEIAEKAAAAERMRLEAEALAMQISSEAGAARQEMEFNAALVQEVQAQLLPIATQQVEALEKAYETGQADLQAVLRARDQHLQLKSTALDALRDFHLARIRYEAALSNPPHPHP